MKKYISKVVTVMLLSLGVAFASSAQIVVKIRPHTPVVKVRPPLPSPKHVWVTGEYVVRDGGYVYNDGYWVVPPERRTHWVEGHWRHRRGGWVWVPGHWR